MMKLNLKKLISRQKPTNVNGVQKTEFTNTYGVGNNDIAKRAKNIT